MLYSIANSLFDEFFALININVELMARYFAARFKDVGIVVELSAAIDEAVVKEAFDWNDEFQRNN